MSIAAAPPDAGMSIALVIPCLNEAEAIAAVVAEVPPGAVQAVIVVDNGSTDGSGAAAAAAGADVIREERRGYGWACWSGFVAAQAAGASIVAFLDGDRSDTPASISAVVGPLLTGEADLVLGRRIMEPGALPPHAVFGNRLALLLIRLLYGVRLRDIPSFRAIRADKLAALNLQERTYGWPVEMVVRAAKRGYRLCEVDVPYRKRIGQSKVSGNWRASLRAGVRMLRTIAVNAWRP